MNRSGISLLVPASHGRAVRLWATGLWAMVASACAAAEPAAPACPADAGLARLVAGSDMILIGRMDVPRQRLTEEARKAPPGYIDIAVATERTMKGAAIARPTIRFYPVDAFYKPSNKAILSLSGVSALLFLTQVDQGPAGLYFAGNSPRALMPATQEMVDSVAGEAARQARIIETWQREDSPPLSSEVHALIARLGTVEGADQQRIFDRLEAMGDAAVPAIIAQMDDRRPLMTQAISLANRSPDAFEAMRHYGPELVVDGLDAILNQITGEGDGSIVNGGSDRQRDAAVAGWRVLAHDLHCPPQPDGSGARSP